MTWSQNYDPFGNWVLSTAVAAIPVLTLFFALVVLRARVWIAAFSGLVAAALIALVVFGMPTPLVAGAVGHGLIFSILRIAWIVISSIFLYNVAVETGQFQVYPYFGTMLGWLGVALTGTDAGSNALFGNLQKVTAEQLHLSPILMGAANSAGGVMGKMIDAQSIVVSSSATRQQGNEAAIFKAVFWHSVILASLVRLIVTLYAYVIPWAIPR